MTERIIYNCHVHALTADEAPSELLKNFFWPPLGAWLSFLLRNKTILRLFVFLLSLVDPKTDNDVLERQARFLETGAQATQAEIFAEIEKQYPPGTKFVVLAVDTTFANLGKNRKSIDEQHQGLLQLAKEKREIIPFFAVDPRHEDILQKVKAGVRQDGFRGIKIYPNLGYYPQDARLLAVYQHCVDENVPVMAHCSPGGLWRFGLTEKERREYGKPQNYAPVLKEFESLRICLAHFGGDQEWEAHLKSRSDDLPEEQVPWCKTIAEMMRSGDYPNLYADISYTLFMPRPHREQVEYCDYLKVLLEDRKIREHVLFGSDFYMSKREKISERELSIMLRSRLGEKLFFQIANINPRRYLYG